MKQFAVCGIGNALVDFDFEVSDATLTRLNIERGVMTLIDKHQERVLLEELDGIKHVKACGGSAANTVITVQQLGGDSFYTCKIADDPTGDFYYRDLERNGIKSNMQEKNRGVGITGKCIAMITPDAERTMHTFLGITESLSVNEVDEQAIKDSDFLYMEGYLVASPTAYQAALKSIMVAKANDVRVSFSLSDLNMVRHFKPQLDEIVALGVDILFANDKEALYFSETTNLEIAADLLVEKAGIVAITLGEKGVLIARGDERITVEAFPVHAIDTIGAGDIFAGALLYAIHKDYSLENAAKIACFAASRVVNKFGPRLDKDRIDEVTQYIKSLRPVAVGC